MSGLRRTEHGTATFIDPGADKPLLTVATVQCVHCGGQFAIQPGSGKIRGICTRCMGPVCGPGCNECVPVEVLLESMEKGITPDQVRRFVATH